MDKKRENFLGVMANKFFSVFLFIVLLFFISSPKVNAACGTTVTVPNSWTAAGWWVDTGIDVSVGMTINVTAAGTWNAWNGHCPDHGPDGCVSYQSWGDQFLNDGVSGVWETNVPGLSHFGTLIGFIGTNPPQIGSYSSLTVAQRDTLIANMIVLGSNATVNAPASGRLWLGMNDDAYSGHANDNSGSILANVQPGPISITSANLVTNAVNVVLCGTSGTSGVLKVTAIGETNNYAAITPTNAVGPGTYTVSFDRPNMPKDTYTSITAEWDAVSPPATTTFSLTNDWIVQGIIRHTQYNTPLESTCTGSWQFAWVFDSSCKFTKVKLNSNFMKQVAKNGTGYSDLTKYGLIRFCASSWPGCCAATRPKGAMDSNAFLLVSTVTGSCNEVLVGDTSVATWPNPNGNTDPTKFYCGDTALLVKSDNTNKAVKTAQDWCPVCWDPTLFNGTQGHIDDYSSSQACGMTDYGNFWTADTQEENQ